MDYEALNSSSESDVDDYTSSDNEELIDMEDEYGAGLATMVRGAEPYQQNHPAAARTARRTMWLATLPLGMRYRTIGWEIHVPTGRFLKVLL